MNRRLPFLDHASDLLLQLYPICLVLLFPHELIKRPLLIALHLPGHDHLRRACGLGHCVMAAPVPLRSFFSSATAGKRCPLHRRSFWASTREHHEKMALFFLPTENYLLLESRLFLLSPGGLVFFGVPGVDTWGYGGVYTGAASSILPRRARARASMWHAGPRIGDGYRKLSLTPTGVPNES